MPELENMSVRELRRLRDEVDGALKARSAPERPSKTGAGGAAGGGGERRGGEGTLRREKVGCGKKACKKCADGPSHGPYWYLYYYRNGKLASKYLGKDLPEGFEHLVRQEAGLASRPEEGNPPEGRGRARPGRVLNDRNPTDPREDEMPTLF